MIRKASPSDINQVVDGLREALRLAREQYVVVRNAATAKNDVIAQKKIQEALAKRDKQDADAEKAIWGAVGAAAAAVNVIPVAGQVLSIVITVGAALIRAALELGKVFGRVERIPGDPIPAREGIDTVRGFDKAAYLWLNPEASDADFSALVYRRLWALSQVAEIDFLQAFPELPRGQVIKRPYLFDALPVVSEVDAAEAAHRRATTPGPFVRREIPITRI